MSLLVEQQQQQQSTTAKGGSKGGGGGEGGASRGDKISGGSRDKERAKGDSGGRQRRF